MQRVWDEGKVTALIPAISPKGVGIYTQQAFGRLKDEISREEGIDFKWKDCRPTGGQLALDAGVPIDQVSQSMRHASTKTTERYYCRARAVPAFARVNEAYNSLFRPDDVRSVSIFQVSQVDALITMVVISSNY